MRKEKINSEIAKKILGEGFYDKFTGKFVVSFEEAQLAKISVSIITLLSTCDYVLICVDHEDGLYYHVAPIKPYILEKLNYCEGFVKSHYEEKNYGEKFKESFPVKDYFADSTLRDIIDNVLVQGIYINNQVDHREPVLGIDREDPSKFCWFEIKDFYK